MPIQRPARRRLAAVLIAAGLLAQPAVGTASPQRPVGTGQEDPGADTSHDGVLRDGELQLDVDVFRSAGADVGGALDDLSDNLSRQLGQVEAARADLSDARTELEEQRQEIAATREEIRSLETRSDQVVVGAYVNPPTEASLEALTADSMSDMAVKQSILDVQASADADVLTQLATAQAELRVQQSQEEQAAIEAERRAQAAEAALADLQAAQSQQALFVSQVQQRLDRQLAEAEALESVDPQMAEEVRAREADLAGRIEYVRRAAEYQRALDALALAQAQAEAEAAAEAERLARERAAAEAAAPGDVGAPSGSLAEVSCSSGSSITVDSSLASNLEALLAAAAADGVTLCGGGYRSPDEQIELRRQHCGTSQYAIYEMPSSQCSPPTARPGSSNHEQGLAIDFTCNGGSVIGSQGSECFEWLDAHAADYGLYNLPSEPWHWSTDGN